MLSSLSTDGVANVVYYGNNFSGVITDTHELGEFITALNHVEPTPGNHGRYTVETFSANITLRSGEHLKLSFAVQSQPEKTIEVSCEAYYRDLVKSTNLLYQWMASNDIHNKQLASPFNN